MMRCAAVSQMMWMLWMVLCAVEAALATASDVRAVGSGVGVDRAALLFRPTRMSASVDHPLIQDAAQFAVDYLRGISDSGIYETLRLVEIEDAATQTATFHDAIHLRVSLASPYFKSGNATEAFQLVVLDGKEPMRIPPKRERSIAIDEFPVMDEDAIEAFWIRMVETRRAKRRALFAQWEREAQDAARGHLPSLQRDKKRENDALHVEEHEKTEIQQQETASVGEDDTALKKADMTMNQATTAALKTKKKKTKKKLSLDDLHAMPTRQLRKMLERNVVSEELRVAITSILDERWDQLERREPQERDEL